ncbi:MAG: CCA tRNA nucleotidyltransferase [Terracidiphilus sp.]
MPDYIYLLENRLSADQQSALRHLREVAREAGSILFLTGDAVRDLTSGHAVRDLEVAMHGNALKLKKTIEKRGGKVWGEDEESRSLYLCFPGTVRVDLVSTHRVEYPKPGKPVYHPASIQEELRRRDFTVNAMAISLNEGSFGLLMDPMNGAADIESRTLRLVSNYGFLEEPSLLIRATRYMARLGWEMDPKTHARYMNAKEEGVIEHLSAQAHRQELEQIGHEEDGLKVLRAFEAEGWMKVLFPVWTSAKADEAGLTALHDLAVELLLQGVHPDMSAAQMRLLTAKLPGKELATLKKQMLRPGFVEEWSSLDTQAAGFAKVLLSKHNSIPSAGFKLFTSYDPEAILWLGFTSKDSAVKERFNLFLKVWPEVRQRIPHALMQEMRITPELPAYHDIVHAVFLELLDGKLSTPEEARAFLEPHSPPAPPPQVTIKRPRAKRGAETKLKGDAFDDESEDRLEDDEDLDDIGGDEDELAMGLHLPKVDLEADQGEESEDSADEDEEEARRQKPASAKSAPRPATQSKPVKPAPLPMAAPKPEGATKSQPVPTPKSQSMPESAVASRTAKQSPKKGNSAAPASRSKSKPVPAKASEARKPIPTEKHGAKAPARNAVKAPAKPPIKGKAKIVAKHPAKAKTKGPRLAPAKKKPAPRPKPNKVAKPAVKKAAHKPARKH